MTDEMRAMHDAKAGELVSVELGGMPSTAVMIGWLESWCDRLGHGARLELEGEIGFGRQCVGILCEGQYPEYTWFDAATGVWPNGDVWSPEDAYHKGEYMAVLGRGDDAIRELYVWGRWFDARRFTLEVGEGKIQEGVPLALAMALGQHITVRLVRPAEVPAEADHEQRFVRMRHLLETSIGDTAMRDVLEALIDEAAAAAEWRAGVRTKVDTALARLDSLSSALDLLEVSG